MRVSSPSQPPQILRQWRARAVAWLGLVLVVCNALIPALLPASPARAASGSFDSLALLNSSEQIVICTPTGVRVISVDAQGNPVEQQDSNREGYCAFCLPLLHSSSGASAARDVLLPPLPVAESVLFLPTQGSVQLFPAVEQTFAQSRAPPCA